MMTSDGYLIERSYMVGMLDDDSRMIEWFADGFSTEEAAVEWAKGVVGDDRTVQVAIAPYVIVSNQWYAMTDAEVAESVAAREAK